MPTDPRKEPSAKSDKPQFIPEIRKQLDEVRRQLGEVAKEKEQNERKAADYFDRLQRLQADMENLQKIAQRQVDTATKQASERLLVKLLPILDALQQAEQMAHESNTLPPDEIAVGLRMLQQQLTEVLASEGLKEIPAIGQPLDTELHEVVGYTESDEKPENTVVEEIRKGYSLNNKVIRPSLVIVSKRKGSEERSLENESAN
ncbi:MAG: nucleotide exchange factor GrpE [Candidatus Bathyarchaeia archaeon]